MDELTEKIIGAAVEVHRLLGPGLLVLSRKRRVFVSFVALW